MKDICSECGGSGWIIVEQGGVKISKRCICFINSQKSRLIENARIPERYQQCSIGNFNTGGRADLIKITDKIRRFVEFFPGDRRGLLLLGPPGVGKTHLAVGIIHYLIEDKNVPCIFYDFRELLNNIRSTYDKGSQLTEKSVIQPLLNTDLLVLDELGAEKTTDWVLDILMYILNYRYNHLAPTIITSNYTDEDFYRGGKDESLSERIGIRLRSRLYEMCETINIQGPDYRRNLHPDAFKKGLRSRLLRKMEDTI